MLLKQTGKLAPATKPWQLLREAISDLRKQERMKSINIFMRSTWHTPVEHSGKCTQCLAGCVMSRRLGVDTGVDVTPSRFKHSVRKRLEALNCFRMGEIGAACIELGIVLPVEIPRYIRVTEYETSPTIFKDQMLDIARRLRKAHGGKPAKRRNPF